MCSESHFYVNHKIRKYQPLPQVFIKCSLRERVRVRALAAAWTVSSDYAGTSRAVLAKYVNSPFDGIAFREVDFGRAVWPRIDLRTPAVRCSNLLGQAATSSANKDRGPIVKAASPSRSVDGRRPTDDVSCPYSLRHRFLLPLVLTLFANIGRRIGSDARVAGGGSPAGTLTSSRLLLEPCDPERRLNHYGKS